MYIDIGQITVDADVATVTHHDHHRPTKAEYGTDLTIKDATCLRTSAALDIDTLVVKRHIMQALDIVFCSRSCH